MEWNNPEQTENKPSEQQSATAIFTHQHIGPLPDPITLEKYNKIQPGFAERIMLMAEKEQASRHAAEIQVISNQHEQHKRDIDTFRIGQMLAILSVLLVVGLCTYCLILGYPTQAAGIAVSVIVGLAAVFIAKDKSAAKHNNH